MMFWLNPSRRRACLGTSCGSERLTKRLASWPGAVAVAEPTSMTWLPLSIALGNAGVALSLVGHAGQGWRHDEVVDHGPGPAGFRLPHDDVMVGDYRGVDPDR